VLEGTSSFWYNGRYLKEKRIDMTQIIDGKALAAKLQGQLAEKTEKLKGETRPINSENDRAFVLDGLKAVDYTVIFDEDTPEELIACLKPSIHVKGGDYKKEDLPETKIVESYGGEVIILNFVEGKSTTNIIEKINKKYGKIFWKRL